MGKTRTSMADSNSTAEDAQENPLESTWTLWYDKRTVNKGKRGEASVYEGGLEEVANFDTVGKFWALYNHLKKPDTLEINSNYHLFKEGIKPMWEDAANAKGGKWVLNLRNQEKHLLPQYWENLVLVLIGETIDACDEVTGAVVARRKAGDRLAIWTRNADNESVIMKIGENIQEAMDAPRPPYLEFQSHEDSMKSGSSYSSDARYRIGPQPSRGQF